MTPQDLPAHVAAELDRPPPEAVQAIVAELLRRHGSAVAAILFYGSCRRSLDMTGLIDLTVLHDGHRAYHERWFPALFGAMLPPNVVQVAIEHDGQDIRAKVAIFSRRQFQRRMRTESVDTTVWARFCQPASLVFSRNAAAREWVTRVIADGVCAAALWAVRLGPRSGTAAVYWSNLFARTYAVELRPEPPGRAAILYGHHAAWFDGVLAPALARAGMYLREDCGVLQPQIRESWRSAWGLRVVCGKVLNVLRLAKAAFTFADGADYMAWKIARHTGLQLKLTDWQRRHPLLAAPGLLWQLHRLRSS